MNRLKQVNKTPDTPVLVGEYVYDALGRRIRKVITNGGLSGNITNGTTDYLYHSGVAQCCEERDGSNNPQRQYVWGHYIDELLQQKTDISGTPADQYPLQDTLYRTLALTDDTGAIVETYDYDAYGNTLIFTSAGTGGNWWADDATQGDSPSCEFLFTGRRFDAESEIYYYRARYYVPEQGRFISRDRIDYDDYMNMFVYTGGRSVHLVDPDGINGTLPNRGGPYDTSGGDAWMWNLPDNQTRYPRTVANFIDPTLEFDGLPSAALKTSTARDFALEAFGLRREGATGTVRDEWVLFRQGCRGLCALRTGAFGSPLGDAHCFTSYTEAYNLLTRWRKESKSPVLFAFQNSVKPLTPEEFKAIDGETASTYGPSTTRIDPLLINEPASGGVFNFVTLMQVKGAASHTWEYMDSGWAAAGKDLSDKKKVYHRPTYPRIFVRGVEKYPYHYYCVVPRCGKSPYGHTSPLISPQNTGIPRSKW